MSSRCKKAKNFQGLHPLNPPPRFCHEPIAQLYSTSRTPPAFHNIRKLNPCSKTDISKTVLVNAWVVGLHRKIEHHTKFMLWVITSKNIFQKIQKTLLWNKLRSFLSKLWVNQNYPKQIWLGYFLGLLSP